MRKTIQFGLIFFAILLLVACSNEKTDESPLNGIYSIDHVYSRTYKLDIKPIDVNADGSVLEIVNDEYSFKLNSQKGLIKVDGKFIIKKDGVTINFYSDGSIFASGSIIQDDKEVAIYMTLADMSDYMYCFIESSSD